MTEYVSRVSGSYKPPKGRNGKQRNALSLRTSFNVVQCTGLYSFSKWNNTFDPVCISCRGEHADVDFWLTF